MSDEEQAGWDEVLLRGFESIRPAGSAWRQTCSPSCAGTSGTELSDIQLFSQLKNLNEIKVALAALPGDARPA